MNLDLFVPIDCSFLRPFSLFILYSLRVMVARWHGTCMYVKTLIVFFLYLSMHSSRVMVAWRHGT